MQDLAAGRIDVAFDTQALTQPLAEAGRFRMLAVTGTERLESLPEVPTMIEAGAPGFTMTAWFALALPKGTPENVVGTLNHARSLGCHHGNGGNTTGSGARNWAVSEPNLLNGMHPLERLFLIVFVCCYTAGAFPTVPKNSRLHNLVVYERY